MKRVIRKLKKIWYTYTGNEDGFLALKIQQFQEAGGVCGKIQGHADFGFYPFPAGSADHGGQTRDVVDP